MIRTIKRATRNIKRNKNYRFIGYIVIFLLFWATLIVPTLIYFQYESRVIENPIIFGYNYDLEDRIDIQVSVSYVDLEDRFATSYIKFHPRGKYSNKNETITEDVYLRWSFLERKFSKDDLLTSFPLNFPIEEGSLRDFPLDYYRTPLNLVLRDGNNEPISTRVKFKAVTTWLRLSVDNQNSEKKFYLHINRTTTSLIFSIFLIIAMWALSIIMMIYAYTYLTNRKPVHAAAILAGVAMLFALPSMRDVQPGVPKIGCLADFLGYFWNVFIISLSSVIIIYCYVLRYNPEKK